MHIEYLRGKENIIADALLRVAPLKPELQDCDTSLNNIEKIPVHHITQIVPVSPENLQEICEATSKNSALSLLAKVVHEGVAPDNQRLSPQYSVITGTSEMKSHVKTTYYTKESD